MDKLPSYISIVIPILARPTAIGPMYHAVPWLRDGEFQPIRSFVRAFEDAQEVTKPPTFPFNPNAPPSIPEPAHSELPVGGGIAHVTLEFDFWEG